MKASYRLKIKKIILNKGNTFLPKNFVASKLNVPEILIGREKEKKIIADNVIEILLNEGSKIIRIFGSAGVGKSSIILYLREASRNEEFEEFFIKSDDFESFPYIFLIYIQMESSIPTGGLILKFFKHIYDEFGGDGFFIELAHRLIGKIVMSIYEIDLKSKKKIDEDFSKRELRKFEDPDDFEDIIDENIKYRTIHKIVVRNYKRINNIYLNNLDQGFINLMCDIVNPNSEIQGDALRRLSESAEIGKYGIIDDISAMQILSNIIMAIKYLNRYCCIIIAIDHLETYTRGSKPENMDEIFKLIMEFRNKISNNLLLIFISTIQGYTDLLNGLRSSTGDINQLFLGWDGGKHNIEPIATEEFIKVIKLYWEKKLYKEKITVLPKHQFFPFCQEGLEFLYEKITLKNIRASFNLLKNTLDEFKNKNYVDELTTRAKMVSKFDMQTHPIERVAFMFDEICSKFFNLDNIASKLEKALELNIKKLKNIKEYPILTVVSNKKVSNLNRRPDVFIQFGKNNEECAIEIQVKAYHNSELSFSELESSIELLNNGITDYCIVLVTRDINPLLVQQLKPYKEKLGFLILDIEELQAYLAILIDEVKNEFFEEWELGKEDVITLFTQCKLDLKDLYLKAKKIRTNSLEEKPGKMKVLRPSLKTGLRKKVALKDNILNQDISHYKKDINQLGEKRIEVLKEQGIHTIKDLAELDNIKIKLLLDKNIGGRISKTLLLKWHKTAEKIMQNTMEFDIES